MGEFDSRWSSPFFLTRSCTNLSPGFPFRNATKKLPSLFVGRWLICLLLPSQISLLLRCFVQLSPLIIHRQHAQSLLLLCAPIQAGIFFSPFQLTERPTRVDPSLLPPKRLGDGVSLFFSRSRVPCAVPFPVRTREPQKKPTNVEARVHPFLRLTTLACVFLSFSNVNPLVSPPPATNGGRR